MKELPAYAAPLFVRIQPELQVTGTFKTIKTMLKSEGYKETGQDPVFFRDDSARSYVKLSETIIQDIASNKAKL